MIIQSIELADYRNYERLSLKFSDGVNIFYGDNAQGKTNILEAIFVSATTRSHRGSRDRELIRFDREESHIRTMLEKSGMEYKIDMHLRRFNTKGIAVNGQKIRKASELIGLLKVVFFSPEDLSIIKDGPSARRRFIDIELCQLDQSYLFHLNQYNKVLMNRNKLLKDLSWDNSLYDSLDVWDEQLIRYGCQIIDRRESFVRELNQIISGIHGNLSGGKENLYLGYEPDVKKELFERKVKESRERDLRLKQTSVGPHKDDCIFSIGNCDIRRFGSQGQQRTAALALKLSEIELVKKVSHDTPVLLLDDVLSELDSSRQNYLLDSIGEIQTIITCTGLEEFINRRFEVDKIFKVVNGTVSVEN
ncbi:MAG: DNA replication/repair protein RecF [Lachnospiraceae bacterium]|nr:DNA replication/repair protein RecF [Lachnospiraceae bacterium]